MSDPGTARPAARVGDRRDDHGAHPARRQLPSARRSPLLARASSGRPQLGAGSLKTLAPPEAGFRRPRYSVPGAARPIETLPRSTARNRRARSGHADRVDRRGACQLQSSCGSSADSASTTRRPRPRSGTHRTPATRRETLTKKSSPRRGGAFTGAPGTSKAWTSIKHSRSPRWSTNRICATHTPRPQVRPAWERDDARHRVRS